MLFTQWLPGFAGRILRSRQRTGSFARRGSTRGTSIQTHAASWMAAPSSSRLGAGVERLEDRSLLAGVVSGLNVNISQLLGNQDESAIAVNPLNSQQLFASSNNDSGGLFAARSIDGGVTWLPSNGADYVIADGLDGLVAACCDPTVTWDQYGNLFLSYINDSISEVVPAVVEKLVAR